jgi:hypothetical protein
MLGAATVRSTSIFATRHAGRQVLVYEAAITTAETNAMVLPIPILSPQSAVELIDLSAFQHLFYQLGIYYYGPPMPSFGSPRSAGPPLEVFTVGSFKASIVPTLADFDRLDSRFHLSPGLAAALGERYADWAFVVYQLAPGSHQLHPFGVSFESRFPEHLFFPTLHVHDGAHAPAQARFAHKLCAQGAILGHRKIPYNDEPPIPPVKALEGFPDASSHHSWTPPLREVIPEIPMPDFVDLRRPLDSTSRFGMCPNADLYFPLAE